VQNKGSSTTQHKEPVGIASTSLGVEHGMHSSIAKEVAQQHRMNSKNISISSSIESTVVCQAQQQHTLEAVRIDREGIDGVEEVEEVVGVTW
jgi:hypothetical protein